MTKADIFVVIFALALLPVLFKTYWGAGNHGDTAIVSQPGKEDMPISLTENQILSVSGPLGESVIEVNDGKVRFSDSPCPTKQCIHAGWLAKGGEFAACLPNKISILVASRDQHFDAINF